MSTAEAWNRYLAQLDAVYSLIAVISLGLFVIGFALWKQAPHTFIKIIQTLLPGVCVSLAYILLSNWQF